MPIHRAKRPDDTYKWVIRDAIMHHLFKRMEELYKKDIEALACENCLLMGYSHKSYAYNGEFFNADWTDGPPIRQKLHESLIPKAKQMNQEFGHPLTVERVMIAGYLASMMAMTPHPGDYLLLLPPALHGVVKDAVAFPTHTTLSSEKIASFMAKHGTQYDLIRQRLALNLIL